MDNPRLEIELTQRVLSCSTDFEEAVIAAVACQLLRYHTIGDGESDDGVYTVPTDLAHKIEAGIREEIREQARAAAPIVAAEVLEQGFTRVDKYGDPLFQGAGKTQTIKQAIAETVKAELVHPSGRRGEGVLAMMLRDEVSKQLRGELKGAVDEAKVTVLEAVKVEAAGAIENALRRALADRIPM